MNECATKTIDDYTRAVSTKEQNELRDASDDLKQGESVKMLDLMDRYLEGEPGYRSIGSDIVTAVAGSINEKSSKTCFFILERFAVSKHKATHPSQAGGTATYAIRTIAESPILMEQQRPDLVELAKRFNKANARDGFSIGHIIYNNGNVDHIKRVQKLYHAPK